MVTVKPDARSYDEKVAAVDYWCISNGFPGVSASAAKKAEAEGWDGMLLPDSQNLTGDVYVSLALAAEATSITATALAARRASSEGQEGLRAFLDKRKPRWTP